MTVTLAATNPAPVDIAEVRAGALSHVRSLRTADGRYRMNEAGGPSLFTDCFALFVRHLLADTPDREEAESLRLRLQAAQDPSTGLFRFTGRSLDSSPLHDRDHVERQLTSFALAALAILGATPRYRLSVLDETLARPDGVARELDRAPWARNPSNAGNRAMFLGSLLWAAADAGDDRARRGLDDWFRWHDSRVRPSGFWGVNHLADGWLGLHGAAHQYVLYAFVNRTPPRIDAAARTALSLQEEDGRFWPVPGSGSCYELDALQILAMAHAREPASRAEIEDAARHALGVVLACRRPDGGFAWASGRPFGGLGVVRGLRSGRSLHLIRWAALVRAHSALTSKREVRATSWTDAVHPVTVSSLYDTWFRLLTLALAGVILNRENAPMAQWRRVPFPNWGAF
jgi:hypothetical protein